MMPGFTGLLGPHLSAEQALTRLASETGLELMDVREVKTGCFRLLFDLVTVLNEQSNRFESGLMFDQTGLHVLRGFYEALDWMEEAPDRYQRAHQEAVEQFGTCPPPGQVWNGAEFVPRTAA